MPLHSTCNLTSANLDSACGVVPNEIPSIKLHADVRESRSQAYRCNPGNFGISDFNFAAKRAGSVHEL
jgi:hypothetical protein